MSLFRTWGIAAGLLAAGWASACVSHEDVAPPGPKYPDQASFCAALAEAVCSPGVVNGCYGVSDADTIAKCRDAFRIEGCNPGLYGYHPEGAEECIELQRVMYSDGLVGQAELDAVHDTCLKALSNSAAAGATCVADGDCNGAQGLRCVLKSGEMGTCQVPVEVLGGDDCTAPNAVCTLDTQYCDGSHCVARQGEGDTCTDTLPCAPDLLCPPGMTQTTCIQKKAAGDTCTTGDECADGFCANMRCRANQAFAGGPECDMFIPG